MRFACEIRVPMRPFFLPSAPNLLIELPNQVLQYVATGASSGLSLFKLRRGYAGRSRVPGFLPKRSGRNRMIVPSMSSAVPIQTQLTNGLM